MPTSGVPFFIASATKTWTITPAGDDEAVVTINATLEPNGPLGRIVLAAMSPTLSRMGRRTLDDLKHLAAPGLPSPRRLGLHRNQGGNRGRQHRSGA